MDNSNGDFPGHKHGKCRKVKYNKDNGKLWDRHPYEPEKKHNFHLCNVYSNNHKQSDLANIIIEAISIILWQH